ncbi:MULTISPECIES: Gfo/Idh/MocA family oxidoreductase [unclassified Chelatococcus]|uniref:Gfo/Idh/MocA family protein n=1 Tax=unclassified Chelatococcus TaxID=2638111 RepID=UPI001BCFE244|nr:MULTISPECIES: Gfo/Idh/MocA family oxidoreductase [unclassified Chelatococcus]MBS7697178.1 Gfo/Idh/MocA family oxidoreductase [Chelatococcus sp. YT9]MBX3556525.1 Gfo/Idh/MocA family oxidoreductase [Chelatococcus sp.]
MAEPVHVGIVGLGRWARVLTRAAKKSDAIKIMAGFSRSEEKREAFTRDTGIPTTPDLKSLLADPSIRGVILTVPNEQHLPVAAEVAKAGKHVYTEKPIASTLEDGLAIAALEKEHGITVTVGHSARLMAGVRRIREAIDAGELGRVALIEANFSNERALELTPQTWRWYKHRAPGGPLSQLAIHMFDLVHYIGGEISQASSIASKLSPVGAEVDDQSLTLLKFQDGKVAYVGSSWTAPGIFSLRVFGSKGLMHYEIDFGVWDTPDEIHKSSSLYIQRGKDGFGKREVLQDSESDMFRVELELFAESCRSGRGNELSADNGNVAVACVYAALQSIESNGQLVKLADVMAAARARAGEGDRHVA